MTTKLLPDAQVPALSLPLVGGGTWTLAEQRPDSFSMIVFYRGLHCPVCKSYLGGLDGLMTEYKAAGFSVVAVSMNDADKAAQTVTDWGLSAVPVAYGLTEAAAREWGLWISKAIKETEAEVFCEPGLFWVRPDGRLYLADISNMPWPRPDLAFLLSKVAFINANAYPARGTY